nr:hypothetical protein Hi04_10k_c4921_00005 [uncultured bacterium]
MYRYMSLFWNPENADSVRSLRSVEMLTSSSSPWTVAFSDQGVLVLHTGIRRGSAEAYPLQDRYGVVLGTLFRQDCDDINNSNSQRLVFDQQETQRLSQTLGQHLLDRYWGRYVAVIRDPREGKYHLLRDPSGMLTCYYVRWNGVAIFFSHIADCITYIPLTLSVNKRQVAAHLLANLKPTRQTGLIGVEDVPGGERQIVERGAVTRTAMWHPAQFCYDAQWENEAQAANKLRTTVQGVVSAWASCHDSIIHCLSGGFDSSVVASCLAQAPTRPHVKCLNIFTGASDKDRPMAFPGISKRYAAKLHRVSSHGDERQFARLTALRCGYPLVEVERHLSRYKLSNVWDAPIAVLPSRYIQNIDQDEAEDRLVSENRATAVLNGEAGDELFLTTFQSLGALDYAYLHGIGSRFVSELRNAAFLSRESIWLVLYEAVMHGLLRRPKPYYFDYLKSSHLMSDMLVAEITRQDIQHPWEALFGRLPPGKLSHVMGLACSGLYYHQTFHRERNAVTLFPLSSQPIVEVCMRIPVYTLLSGGMTRGLARRAFSDILPPEITKRTVKGYTFSFAEQLVDENMDFIRESLIDGALVDNGILDRQKLIAYLVRGQPFRTVSATQVLIYVGAEAWIRQWATAMNQRRVA